MAKNISFKVSDSETQKLESIYPNLNFAAQRAIKSWSSLRESTLRELKGQLDKKELACLTDLAEMIKFEPNIAHNKEIILTALNDAIEFQKLDQKWQIDADKLRFKINELKSSEVFFLFESLALFIDTGRLPVELGNVEAIKSRN